MVWWMQCNIFTWKDSLYCMYLIKGVQPIYMYIYNNLYIYIYIYVPSNLQIYAISNCAVQIINCISTNQIWTCAATFAHFRNCSGMCHQPLFWAGRQSTHFRLRWLRIFHSFWLGKAFFTEGFKTLSLIIGACASYTWSLPHLYWNLETTPHNFEIGFLFRNWLPIT